MTLDESQISDKAPLAHLISIYTANGTPMPVSHKGTISTPSLSLSDTFQTPKFPQFAFCWLILYIYLLIMM